MPPRRPTRGRHRRPKHTVAPVTFTAATVAAFVVSGVNVPGAIGAAGVTMQPVAQGSGNQAASVRAAAELRDRIAIRNAERVSRLRSDRDEVLQAAGEAARRARILVERAQPTWVLPILHYHLTAGFGEYGLWSHAHTGQDFAAPTGTPVRAAGAGRIIFAAYDGSYGNKIAIEHANGLVTWYAHLSAFVRTSGVVKVGELIGRVGSTGNTTGPHLHFEVRPHDGAPVPPLTWLREHHIKY